MREAELHGAVVGRGRLPPVLILFLARGIERVHRGARGHACDERAPKIGEEKDQKCWSPSIPFPIRIERERERGAMPKTSEIALLVCRLPNGSDWGREGCQMARSARKWGKIGVFPQRSVTNLQLSFRASGLQYRKLKAPLPSIYFPSCLMSASSFFQLICHSIVVVKIFRFSNLAWVLGIMEKLKFRRGKCTFQCSHKEKSKSA